MVLFNFFITDSSDTYPFEDSGSEFVPSDKDYLVKPYRNGKKDYTTRGNI